MFLKLSLGLTQPQQSHRSELLIRIDFRKTGHWKTVSRERARYRIAILRVYVGVPVWDFRLGSTQGFHTKIGRFGIGEILKNDCIATNEDMVSCFISNIMGQARNYLYNI